MPQTALQYQETGNKQNNGSQVSVSAITANNQTVMIHEYKTLTFYVHIFSKQYFLIH